MKFSWSFCCILLSTLLIGQDNYFAAQKHFEEGRLDSARYYIQRNLSKRPSTDDYFLSALIHEAEGQKLRAAADYEAVVQRDPSNLEAYFQKGLIYYENASLEQAVKDFTLVINNHTGSETNAIYFVNDAYGTKETRLTTLQSIKGSVFQYRGLAYKELGKPKLAMADFNQALELRESADAYINRSQLFVEMDEKEQAINDLKAALTLEPDSYLAWFNLAMIDESARLPEELSTDTTFSPMLNLMGANAYESEDFTTSINFYTNALRNDGSDDLALLGRGKSYLKLELYAEARRDFIASLRINPERIESLFLIGNSFFYEKNYQDAIGFYERYLSIDQEYENVWYNTAMAYLSLQNEGRACQCLAKADELGMQSAPSMIKKHCQNQ